MSYYHVSNQSRFGMGHCLPKTCRGLHPNGLAWRSEYFRRHKLSACNTHVPASCTRTHTSCPWYFHSAAGSSFYSQDLVDSLSIWKMSISHPRTDIDHVAATRALCLFALKSVTVRPFPNALGHWPFFCFVFTVISDYDDPIDVMLLCFVAGITTLHRFAFRFLSHMCNSRTMIAIHRSSL